MIDKIIIMIYYLFNHYYDFIAQNLQQQSRDDHLLL